MRSSAKRRPMWLLLGFPAGLLLFWLASLQPALTERVYSSLIYRFVMQPLSLLTGLLPFSVAEVLVVSLTIVLLWYLLRGIMRVASRPATAPRQLGGLLLIIGMVLSLLYLSFVSIWGLNYNRLPFGELVGLEVRPSETDELAALCRDLIQQANLLRAQITEDAAGVMHLPAGEVDALRRADLGYRRLSEQIPELGGRFGRPKPVMLSAAWSYTGIGGMYFPFTGEANVNVHMPDVSIPMATAHEMAHQRGFAREDEANYIAYLVCMAHPDVDYQYSGIVLALTEAMRSLFYNDRDAWQELQSLYGAGLKRDLQYRNDYWQQHQGRIYEISHDINDSYLKANNQTDGVQSYGRMVDLLLAARRAE